MAEQKTEKKGRPPVEDNEILVRILGQDIPGSKNVYSGLTRIKGISWVISNALCRQIKLNKNTKIATLTKDDISKIELALKNLDIPVFLKNRRSDFDSGINEHLFGINLDMKKEFDIKRLKQIRSYKGNRHSLRLPVRGQRTRSHFRKIGIAVGVKKASK
jgi:small subunit ribosomal protein S13